MEDVLNQLNYGQSSALPGQGFGTGGSRAFHFAARLEFQRAKGQVMRPGQQPIEFKVKGLASAFAALEDGLVTARPWHRRVGRERPGPGLLVT
jgi:hypothetical protein